MLDLAFVVPNLGPNQLSYYLTKNLNKWVEDPQNVGAVFLENIVRPLITPKFARYNCVDIMGYSGNIIATTINSAEKVLENATTLKRYFYIWDLEYLRTRDYIRSLRVIANPRIQLICRSKDHALAIENGFNRSPVGIVEDFNISQLAEVLNVGQHRV